MFNHSGLNSLSSIILFTSQQLYGSGKRINTKKQSQQKTKMHRASSTKNYLFPVNIINKTYLANMLQTVLLLKGTEDRIYIFIHLSFPSLF